MYTKYTIHVTMLGLSEYGYDFVKRIIVIGVVEIDFPSTGVTK